MSDFFFAGTVSRIEDSGNAECTILMVAFCIDSSLLSKWLLSNLNYVSQDQSAERRRRKEEKEKRGTWLMPEWYGALFGMDLPTSSWTVPSPSNDEHLSPSLSISLHLSPSLHHSYKKNQSQPKFSFSTGLCSMLINSVFCR